MPRIQAAALATLASLALPALTAQDDRFFERMDFGPFLAQTYSSSSRADNTALKGVAVRLGSTADPAGVLFDTELLRVACVWTGGFVALRGTPFDGSHGPHSRTGGPSWCETAAVPGWSLDGAFDDPRPIAGHGPLPRSLGRYRGLYRGADRVVFAYDIAGSRVLDSVVLEGDGDQRRFVRTLDLSPCKTTRTLLVADFVASDGGSEGGLGNVEFDRPASGVLVAHVNARKRELVERARVESGWQHLPWGAARGDLPIDQALSAAITEHLKAQRKPNPTSAGGGQGNARRRSDDAGEPRAQVRSLPGPLEVHRIHTYAQGEHAAQVFTLYGSSAQVPPHDPEQWTKIADVDTSRLAPHGRHGAAVAAPEGGALGTFRHLLLIAKPRGDRAPSLQFVAIEALGKDHGVRLPARLATAFALRGASGGVTLAADSNRTLVRVPPHDQPVRFAVVTWHGSSDAAPAATQAMNPDAAVPPLAPSTRGGPARFAQTYTAKGTLGTGTGAYVVDTLPVPFDNAYRSWMRTGAFDFFADGTRAAVSTWNGDVWIVSGIDDQLAAVTWKRFAAGLFDPLGLKIVGDVVHVHGRDGITRLHDTNGDGEADFYECFNNDVWITDGFHEFAFDLHTDPAGNFYFSKGGPVNPGGRGFQKILPHHGCILKLSKDGETLEVFATGFRANNGIGVGPNGEVTSGDNEGTWMPKCRLSLVTPGSFNGCVDTAHRTPAPTGYDKPLCWLPHDVDNSSGSQVWVTSDKWGPLQGELLHLSYGTCSVFKVLKETVGGQVQGGVVRLPLSFASSCMRARFNPKDGQLYVCGLKGWQTSAAQDGALQRVRYTGKPLHLPVGLEVQRDGVLLTFSDALDPETANDPASYDVAVWDYVWGGQYGSPHISTIAPAADMTKMGGKIDIDYRNSDTLAVKRAELRGDKQVFLRLEGLKPVMQMQIKLNVDAKDGGQIKHTIYNTIHVVK